jgi:thiol:disulfide interchange protein DsbC
MKSTIVVAALVVTALTSFTATAGEADVRAAAEARLGKVDKITRAPISGLWEVVAKGELYYMDDKGNYLISGDLFDIKSRKNLSNERRKDIWSSAINSSLDSAIKQVRGNGKRVLVTFEDPNCGYCKKLAKDIAKIKDVTVYTFLLASLGEDSRTKARGVWCSADRVKTWNDWMLNGTQIPPAAATCDASGFDRSVELGQALRIDGVPALFFVGGERVGGYIPAAEIEKRLAATP